MVWPKPNPFIGCTIPINCWANIRLVQPLVSYRRMVFSSLGANLWLAHPVRLTEQGWPFSGRPWPATVLDNLPALFQDTLNNGIYPTIDWIWVNGMLPKHTLCLGSMHGLHVWLNSITSSCTKVGVCLIHMEDGGWIWLIGITSLRMWLWVWLGW